MASSVTCVLMGVAEVKVPLQRLPREVRIQVANASHWAVLYSDRNDADKPKDGGGGISRSDSEEPKQNSHEPKDTKNKQHSISNDESNKEYRKDIDLSRESEKFIGEVDNFYGLREVEVRCEENRCQITHGDDTVMQHRTRDVIVAMSVKQLRVVYVTRCSSYSRAAVVLQMRTQQDIQQLLGLFPHAVIDPLRPDTDSSEMPMRDNKASWSREMGKKFSAMLTSITAPAALQVRRSPMMTRKTFNTPTEPSTESSAPQSDHSSSDSDSDEDDVTDGVDGKSSGEYYKEMGLDASVQERLYDNATDTDSRSSNSSLESSLSMIEAELKFFFDTDSDFLKCLMSLPEDRQRLSRDETPQFIRENLTLLFAQVKSLTLLHTKLHAEFETCSNDLQKLSETIVRHQSEYKYYVYFMENIPTVDRILQTHKDYFKQHVPDMPEKLRKPRMRLHYYVLTLETLHKRSSNADDKNALQNAIVILKRVLKKADSQLFLGAVEGAPFDLTNFGTLIRHSDLALRRGPGDLPRRVYHVLMLKDLLLLTSRNGMNYRYVTSFRMDQVGLGKYERGILFNLEVRNGPRGQVVHYTFKAKNINMQQLWIKDLEANLKEKICPNTTPRNSLIETDFDARHSSKTRGRQAQLINKATDRSVSQESQNDIEVVVDSRAGRTDNNTTWTGSGRRAAIKKTSTVSTRNRPVARQQSGYTSDGTEGGGNKWKFSDKLPDLTLWSHFPYLKVLCEQQTKPSGIEGTPRALIHSLLVEETKYIDDLVKTLGLKLEEDLPQPPTCLVFQVRHLYEFHTEVFQPLLQKSATTGDKIEVAQCFVDCSDALKPQYSRYLADLSQLYNELLENNLLNHYKLPVEQLKQYIVTLSVLQREDEEVIPSLQMALSILRECISTANTILLTEMIEGAPFPLEEQGPVLYEGPAKVRWTGIPIRQDFHVVLLETMILLLESHPPIYRYVDSLRMDTVGLGPPSDGYSFMLEVRTAATKTQTYVFKNPSQTAKKYWLNEITRVLTLQVDRLKEKQKRRFGNDKRELKVLESDDPDKYKFPVPAARRRPDNTEQCQDNPDKKALETHM